MSTFKPCISHAVKRKCNSNYQLLRISVTYSGNRLLAEVKLNNYNSWFLNAK